MSAEKIDSVLDSFIIANPDLISTKLKYFTEKGSDQIHVAWDFDRTMTKNKTQDGIDTTTWGLFRKYLTPEAQRIHDQYYHLYRPKEAAGIITNDEANIWWGDILELFKNSQISLAQIEKEITNNMPIRPGVKEIFDICQNKNIPTIIISAGLANVIELWCLKQKIFPAVIVSTRLIFSDSGLMTGWDDQSVVHVLNKKELGHKEVLKIKETHPLTILIGDNINDAEMVEGDKEVIRILVNDPRNDDDDCRRDLIVPQGFDLMTTDPSLMPAVNLLNLF